MISKLFFSFSMFETSNDIFLLAAALSVLLLTGFLCWVLYYVASILKEVKQTVRTTMQLVLEVERRASSLLNGFETLRDKILVGVASLTSIAQYIGRFAESWHYRQEERARERSERSKTKK